MKKYLLDEKCSVDINGDRQYLHLRSNCPAGPVLLFVHGGPGVCDRSWVMPQQSPLLAGCCVMVCWDQRMAGKSYRRKNAGGKMTVAQQVGDLRAVVEYLCRRFGQTRIFLVGHSWGSILSCLYVQKYPETVAAYVGMGQFVNGPENERLSYEFTLRCARQRHDAKALRALEKIGAPKDGRYAGGLDAMMVQRNYMTRFGGGCWREHESLFRSVLVPFVTSGEYRLIPDLYRYARGAYYCLEQLWPEVVSLEFDKTIRSLAVPVYLFQGDHDQNTPVELSRPWFDALEAPYKEWVPFAESAHSPIKEEPELWGRLLRQKLFGCTETT